MRKYRFAGKAMVHLLLLTFMQMLFFPTIGMSQPIECQYDADNPTLESARLSFRTLNYACAEEEINAFLGLDDITIEEKADAHVLLAAVYYAKLKNDEEKRNRVINQFKEAFKAYRAWKGDLDISSTEFFEMMQTARAQVDEEAESAEMAAEEEQPAVVEEPVTASQPEPEAEQPAEEETEQPAVASMPPYQGDDAKASKPWYKKWWAIGLGVGLVAGVVVLAGGGGSDDGSTTPAGELPDFPDPPPAGKKSPDTQTK